MAQAFMIPSTDMLDAFYQNALLTKPEGKRLTLLEQEMANILSRTDLTDRQKMDQFGYTLQKFQKLRGDIIEKGGLMDVSATAEKTSKETEGQISKDVFAKIQEIIQQAIRGSAAAPAAASAPATHSPAAAAPSPQSTPVSKRTRQINLDIKRLKQKENRQQRKKRNKSPPPKLSTPSQQQASTSQAATKGILAKSADAIRKAFSPRQTRASTASKNDNISGVNFFNWDRK